MAICNDKPRPNHQATTEIKVNRDSLINLEYECPFCNEIERGAIFICEPIMTVVCRSCDSYYDVQNPLFGAFNGFDRKGGDHYA